jgi:hypothetical protein
MGRVKSAKMVVKCLPWTFQKAQTIVLPGRLAGPKCSFKSSQYYLPNEGKVWRSAAADRR